MISHEADALVEYLDNRIAKLLSQIEQTEMWRAVAGPQADPHFARDIMKEIYLEIVSYQPHVIEAAIAAVAQMPRNVPVSQIKAMLRHQAEEFDHGEMALRDYVALGGDESYARNRRMGPASFAAAGVWWMIVKTRDPFAYLGALYPFEGLTPLVSAKAKAALQTQRFPSEALGYIEFHSTEDLKHTAAVKHLIRQVVSGCPKAEQSIRAGFDYFLNVYPIPVWQEAYERASRSRQMA